MFELQHILFFFFEVNIYLIFFFFFFFFFFEIEGNIYWYLVFQFSDPIPTHIRNLASLV